MRRITEPLIGILVCLTVLLPAGAAGAEGELEPLVHFRPLLGDPRKGLNPELFTKETGSTLWLDHTAGYLVPKLMYYDTHPEYFAMRRTGERIPKDTRDSYIHLCFSNPDVVKISTERLLGWMRNERDKRYFCVTQGDGPDWCQCAECKAMDVAPGNYSDRLLVFMNQLARAAREEFPDNILLGAAYCGTDVAPVRERPEENVWIMYAPYWGVALSMVHPLTHPSNAEALAQLEGWLEAAPDNMAIYDYNMRYCPSWYAMARKIEWYCRKGIRGLWFCGSPSNFRDLFEHVVREEMIRDPNQDPEAVARAYAEDNYGAAAGHVMQYLALNERQLAQGYPRGIHQFNMPHEYYADNGFGERALELFDKMIEATGGTKLEGKFRKEKELTVTDMKRAAAEHAKRGKYDPTAPEPLENGVRLSATCFVDGRGPMDYSWFCPARTMMIVYPAKGPYPTSMKANFELDAEPDGPAELKLEGQNADKDLPPSTPIRVTINGRNVYQGPCDFPPRGWSWRTLPIEEGVLRKGINTIRIENLMDSARIDHWWVAISEAEILL